MGGIVDEECPICGNGVLRLGPAAPDIYEPAVVSQAVAIALRESPHLAHTMATLRDAGIVASPLAIGHPYPHGPWHALGSVGEGTCCVTRAT